MSGEKELIWVSKELAEEYKSLESTEAQEAAVKKVISQKRLDLDAEQELLSESMLIFKSVCLAHKKELTKVYNEQSDALYKMWEDMGDVSSEVVKHAKATAELIAPIRTEVAALRKQIDGIKHDLCGLDLYIPENMCRLAESVAGMDENTKVILQKLLSFKE